MEENFEDIGSSAELGSMVLNFRATTGGNFSVTVEQNITVETLKKIVSKKLKVSKERIALIFLEKELQDGTLTENGIVNNSKIILTPNVETGLSAQRAENTVMQALESLNDAQVNDFLSGKSPLNLSVRLGDHMMLIQLQLSTLSPSQQNTLKQKVAHASALKTASKQLMLASSKNSAKNRSDIPSETAPSKRMKPNEVVPECQPEDLSQPITSTQLDNEQSPIKSLSNLVSSPEVQNLKRNKMFDAALYTEDCTDPIAAKLTSCLCTRLSSKGLYPNSNCSNNNNCEPTPSSSSTMSANEVNQVDQPRASTSREGDQRDWSQVKSVNKQRQLRIETIRKSSRASPVPSTSSSTVNDPPLNTSTDNPALAEASRNLTQTLRKLSKRVFTNRINISEKSSTSPSSSAASSSSQALSTSEPAGTSGAVIESMKHHGKGIYSGTFSGTLSPSLQDKFGRPKRDISTIIHILNDLLSATPQCAKNGAKIIFEPTSGPSTLASSGSTTSLFKVRRIKTSSSSIESHKVCPYGQCKGHAKSDSNDNCRVNKSSTNKSPSDCTECSHNLHTKKIEMENNKTKTKLDHLRMVMQQKKKSREARKLQASPYNVKAGGVLLASLPLMNTSDDSKGDESLDSSLDSSNAADSSSSTPTFGLENHLVEEASIA